MAKQPKLYTIKRINHNRGTEHIGEPATLEEHIENYSYTLECGASYQHEKGNKKINTKPTTIKGLISNLNKAVNNSASNGYAGVSYELVA